MASQRDDKLHELDSPKTRAASVAEGQLYSMWELQYARHSPTRFERFIDSFKPYETSESLVSGDHLSQYSSATTLSRDNPDPYYYDLRAAAIESANAKVARRLKGRHLQMIAIGGAVGSGLFVASGLALQTGGPASLLIAFSTIGVMLYCTSQALGELAVIFPIVGSFSSYATRFIDPSWGFAMGWIYAIQWLIVLPLELIAATLTIRYWTDQVPGAVFVTIFLAITLLINLTGVKGYGEAESTFSVIKVIAIVGFILLGIVLNCGGTPDRGYIGGEYWHDPGAFNNGFKGLCSVFVTAAFAFGGTELVGLAAAETTNPRKSIPTAMKQVFWRITLFYVVALTLVGLLVPYNDPRLDGANSVDANASPFVIAIEEAGIQVLPSVMNVVVLIAVLSVGNSAVFAASRTVMAMAKLNHAPRIFGYIDRKGRPLVAIGVTAVFGLLAYLIDLRTQGSVFDWLVAISGLATIFIWFSICLCHIRFRRAWASRGRSLNSIPFTSQVGVVGSYFGCLLNLLVLIAQFWVGAFPIGWETMGATKIVQNFFQKFMSMPIIILLYLGHKVFYNTHYVKVREMDVDTGRRHLNLPILVEQEDEQRASWPKWKKLYKFFC